MRRTGRLLQLTNAPDSDAGVREREPNSLPVIARSRCDEAIQNPSTEKILDCFATLATTTWIEASDLSPQKGGER